MPDSGARVVHRWRDHVAGVNWRPTRLAEEVPHSRVCGLCFIIPKKTVQLPCSHFLCESCHEASTQDGSGGVCPLDRESFADDECSWSSYPYRKAEALKAHCWNEAHGCAFVGKMETVLRHYENECAFHAITCPRCSEQVLHNNLVMHQLAGCSGNTVVATGGPSSQGTSLSVHDVKRALEELKRLVREPYQDQVPTLQSQMNQLMEQSKNSSTDSAEATRVLTNNAEVIKREVDEIVGNVSTALSKLIDQSRNDSARLMESIHEAIKREMDEILAVVSAALSNFAEQSKNDAARLMESINVLSDSTHSIKGEVTQIGVNVSTALAEVGESQQPSSEDKKGRFPDSGENQGSLPCHMEKMLILRKLEIFAKSSLSAGGQQQRVHSEVHAVIKDRHPDSPVVVLDRKDAAEYLSSERSILGRAYRLKISNANDMLTAGSSPPWKKWAEVTVWHRRDTFVEVTVHTVVSDSRADLEVVLKSVGVLESSHLLSPRSAVTVLNEDRKKNRLMRKFSGAPPSDSKFCSFTYRTKLKALGDEGFLKDGELMFELAMYDESANERLCREPYPL